MDVAGCLKLTDAAVISLAQECNRTLTRLNLSGCDLISDEAVIFLAKTCLSLQLLDLRRCISVSPLACYSLQCLNANLQVLYNQ